MDESFDEAQERDAEEHAFDESLDSLDDALAHDHEDRDRELSVRRRFEESEEWLRHKRWHEEQGTPARLQVWEETEPQPPSAQPVEEQQQAPRHTVKVGGCDCQPKLAFMELKDDGKVVAGIPQPLEEAKTYNAGRSDAGTEYQGRDDAPNNIYQPSQGQHKELYR